MDLTLPTLLQRPSPNYSPTLISHALLVLHLMEGGYEGSINWLCKTSTQASAHLCINETGVEVSQLVPLCYKAWAQCAFNSCSISLEMPGFVNKIIPDASWDGAAKIFGWLCVAYAIPATWAQNGKGRGICQHIDLGEAGGNHYDCCAIGSQQWLDFVDQVAQYKTAFEALPKLPDFALHGFPNPNSVKWPPYGEPAPNHGGANRKMDREISTHYTASGFPLGSVADCQWRLNKTGANLFVDGVAGEKTRKALAAFQLKNDLDVTIAINAATWSKLLSLT